jgi:hypothetical protein
MANNNQNIEDINNNDNNDNNDHDDDDSPIQQRSFLSTALNTLLTPLRDRAREQRQLLIDNQTPSQQRIRDLELDIGLRTSLFAEDEAQNITEEEHNEPDERKEEEKEEIEKEKEEEPEEINKQIMSGIKYNIGGVSIEFNDTEPEQNTDYNVGVVISKSNRPEPGSDGERKLIDNLCKNQYTNYKRPETSMKSIERLLQSRSILDTIEATETILTKYDMKEPFTIVFPADPTLKRVTLKLKIDGSGIQTVNVLTDFRRLTTKEVALSCAWWNLHGNYKDKDDKKQSYGRDMNWSYLHFKNHVDVVLYNDTDKEFHTYDKKERGGPLFFKLLTDSVLTANEDSLAALESTIKVYNIASDGKDDVPEAIKVLKAGSKTIQAMREDGSGKRPLPERFVVDMITVFKTTSVDMFNKKMEAYLGSLELAELVDEAHKINTPVILNKVFYMAGKYHKQLFDAGTWDSAVLAKAKSSFAAMWRNRCWNCEKENCSMTKCKQPINSEKCERNRLQWLSDVKGNSSSRSARNDDRRGNKKKEFPEWRAPEPSENNKRVIYGRPYTWDGRQSWVLDNTPPSGLSDTPPGILKTSGDATVPTQITPPSSDDATAMTAETGFTTEEKNELRRIEANLQNMGTNISGFGAFINNLSNKH